MVDSPRKIETAPDPAIRFGSRQLKVQHLFMADLPITARSHQPIVVLDAMTRREGTSNSNSVVATGHSVIEPAPDPAIRFGSQLLKVQHLLMADPPVTARSHQKIVLDKSWWGQGPAWRPFF